MRNDGITLEEKQKINEFFDYLNYQGWGYLYTNAAKKIVLKGVMPTGFCPKCGDAVASNEDSLCGGCAGSPMTDEENFITQTEMESSL